MNKGMKSEISKIDRFTAGIKRGLIRIKELFLGRTRRQMAGDKPSFIGKRMLPLFAIFTFYSFVFFIFMNITETNPLYPILWFILARSPYTIGIAMSFTLLELGLAFCNIKFLKWMFGELYWVKHLVGFAILMTGNYFLAAYILTQNFDIEALLLLFAMLWLIMQSVRFYLSARIGATKIETKFSNQYSPFLYLIAQLTPLIVLGILLFLSWTVRYTVVVYTLDFISVFLPDDAFNLYYKQMSAIIPMLYVGLLTAAIMMFTQRLLSRKKGSTKRAGVYDTFTFAIICFIMYLYAIYNIFLYLIVDPEFLQAFTTVLNDGQVQESRNSIFFLFEFGITLIFLAWIIIDLNKRFQKGFLFFSRDGFVIFLLGTIFAQTTARYGLIDVAQSGYSEQSELAQFIQYDYIVLPWIILGFLGITILLYWIKPHETSMFIRTNEAAIDKDDKMMESVLAFFKREFIRRGEPFEVNDLMIKSLQSITDRPPQVIWSLIHRLDARYVDVHLQISEEKIDGKKKRKVVFDFIPVTERYQGGKEAKKKAQKFLTNQFFQTITKKSRKTINLTGTISQPKKTSSKQSDSFIQALSVQYGKKIKDQEAKRKSAKEKEFIVKKAIDEETVFIVYKLIKEEYLKRVRQISDFPDEFRFRISEITHRIELSTNIPMGEVFILIQEMVKVDSNLHLSEEILDEKNPDDKYIEFIPIDDFDVYYELEKYRPNSLTPLYNIMRARFAEAVKYQRTSLQNLTPTTYDDRDEEFDRSHLSRWYAQLMHYFVQNYPKIFDLREKSFSSQKMQYMMKKIIKSKKENEYEPVIDFKKKKK